jgi:hypothetical protein
MSAPNIPLGLFRLGNLVATASAMESLTHEEMVSGLRRHQSGDWGDLQSDDQAENSSALLEGRRLMSRYTTAKGKQFWIITEADRSATTVLLPEDY